MTDVQLYSDIAERIRNAYVQGPIAPISPEIGAQNVDAAYAIQSLNTQRWKADGRRIVGRKIGLTSAAVQNQLGVNQPDFGVLFADMQVAENVSIPYDRLSQPKIEAEIAMILGRDLPDPVLTLQDVQEAVDYLLPALEIVDSRILNWKIGIADTIADNASSGLFVLGSIPRTLDSLDLSNCAMALEADGRVVSHGLGAECLGHPMNAVLWLAQTLAERGDPLKAGDIVLSGALGPMIPLEGVKNVVATIDGLGVVRTFRDF
jgi:2-keto-4-pentenoate hydratase